MISSDFRQILTLLTRLDESFTSTDWSEQLYYHGTRADQPFDNFDLKFTGGIGFHFTTNYQQAIRHGKRVIAAKLRLGNIAPNTLWKETLDNAWGGNPRGMAIKRLQQQGYNSVSNIYETIVFDPEQIKIVSQNFIMENAITPLIWYNVGEVPQGWWVHGRNGRQDLDTGYVIQCTYDLDIADHYAGRNGSIWYIRPRPESRVLNLENKYTHDMDRIVDRVIHDEKDGTLPFADDIELSGSTIENAVRGSFAPIDIVNSAEAFDNATWVEWLYNAFEPDFVITPNGGVVLNIHGVETVCVRGKLL